MDARLKHAEFISLFSGFLCKRCASVLQSELVVSLHSSNLSVPPSLEEGASDGASVRTAHQNSKPFIHLCCAQNIKHANIVSAVMLVYVEHRFFSV